MKKLAAILVLGIFMFNLFGYRLLVSYKLSDANIALESAFDNNQYDNEALISIKKAVSLPYYNNTTEFSRINGEVEIDGIDYKYVKCRIYNDSLEMLCVPNTQKTKIKNAKNDFFSITADIEKANSQKNKSGNDNSLKKMLSEFEELNTCQLRFTNASFTKKNIAFYHSNLGKLHKAFIEQPPDTN